MMFVVSIWGGKIIVEARWSFPAELRWSQSECSFLCDHRPSFSAKPPGTPDIVSNEQRCNNAVIIQRLRSSKLTNELSALFELIHNIPLPLDSV